MSVNALSNKSEVAAKKDAKNAEGGDPAAAEEPKPEGETPAADGAAAEEKPAE